MKYNDIDISKYDQSLYHLNEVAYKYRMTEILEYDENEPLGCPDTAYVVVARSMEAMGLEDLLEWKTWWRIWKHHREDLSVEQLTAVVYSAMADFKQSYLDLMEPENESDVNKLAIVRESLETDRGFIKQLTNIIGEIPEAFDYTIKEEDLAKCDRYLQCRSLLREMGITAIKTTDDVDAIMWRIAFLGSDISCSYRNAIAELTINNRLKDYLDFKRRQYNRQIETQRSIRKNCEIEKEKKKDNAAQKHVLKLENVISKKNELITRYNNIISYQKENYLKMLFQANNDAKHKSLVLNHFILHLKNPYSILCKSFDFNDEYEMDYYLKLFKMAKRGISPSVARRIAKVRINDEQTRELFLRKVEELNIQICKSRDNSKAQ